MLLSSEKLKLNQIKKRVGDAWALIYNPEYNEKNKLVGGDLVCFNNDKNKLFEFLKQDYSKNKYFAVLYMGKLPVNEVYVL